MSTAPRWGAMYFVNTSVYCSDELPSRTHPKLSGHSYSGILNAGPWSSNAHSPSVQMLSKKAIYDAFSGKSKRPRKRVNDRGREVILCPFTTFSHSKLDTSLNVTPSSPG